MTSLQRLVRIRAIQEQATKRNLVHANIKLSESLSQIDTICHCALVSAQSQKDSFIAGDMESFAEMSVTLVQLKVYAVKLRAIAKNELLLLESCQERYRLANCNRRKAESLCEAQVRNNLVHQEKELQKQADDYYLNKLIKCEDRRS